MDRRTKCEVQVHTINEVGRRLQAAFDVTKQNLLRLEGGKQALVQAKAKVEELFSIIDQDVEQNEMDLEQAALAKKWVRRASSTVLNVGTQVEVQSYQVQGRAQEGELALQIVHSMLDQAVAHLKEVPEEEPTLGTEGDTQMDPGDQ